MINLLKNLVVAIDKLGLKYTGSYENNVLNLVGEAKEILNRKIIPLDLTDLSPRAQDKVIEAIEKALWSEMRGLAEDIPHYSEGSVKNEMVAWESAASKLGFDIRKNIKEWMKSLSMMESK